MERHRFTRSVRSEDVRAVREDREASLLRSVCMTLMHFLMGIEGKSASASKETRISSASGLTSFIFWMNSTEFLHEKGEFLRRGRRRGMRKDERAS